MDKIRIITLIIFCTISISAFPQQSIAREWNEILLDAIRVDYARPTVHARNLFHTSIAMYDSWALFDANAEPYFLGQTNHNYTCTFDGITTSTNTEVDRAKMMNYAVYRLLLHRFKTSPGAVTTIPNIHNHMLSLGHDTSFISTDYSTDSYAALGNYLAEKIIDYGLQDGSNEQNDYANLYYSPVNSTILPVVSGNPNISNPNHWQPITLDVSIDQSGNVLPKTTPDFLSPEWGNVSPFALRPTDSTHIERNGGTYPAYHNPGPPPYIDELSTTDYYKWGFQLVSVWSSHLDPADSIKWDISPTSIGNNPSYPTTWSDYPTFYDMDNGGDASQGHSINPFTNLPYQTQIVPRGDFTRVLAEFWADGPDSETPPGHWFTILNYVSDHTAFEKKYKGIGAVKNNLEWDIKAYFTLAGTMHDAAIAAWGIKGAYDYLRPISAIRYMADNGQCSDNTKSNYSINGIPLKTGYIETVETGDPLAGTSNVNIGKIKVYAWQGPDSVSTPATDMAEVGWILAENWWPYQRPSFVTPPFAGYISGHSVFSRAAAEVMVLLTGDEYFPGGMGEFLAKKNEFLVFEEGPSTDITLQWATYKDASDQTSLSRIWGGIHPPADDIPGRIIGEKIGIQAFKNAEFYFNEQGTVGIIPKSTLQELILYPNPVVSGNNFHLKIPLNQEIRSYQIINNLGQVILSKKINKNESTLTINSTGFESGVYHIQLIGKTKVYSQTFISTEF